MAAQHTLEPESGERIAARLHLGNIWELTRRFSGLVAIVVLAGTMYTLAIRAEDEGARSAPLSDVAVAPASSDVVTGDPAESDRIDRLIAYMSQARADAYKATIVYYLYDTQEQYDRIQSAESEAELEANGGFRGYDYSYYAMDTSTSEGERQARDTIFEAMLADSQSAKNIVVRDVREPSQSP